MDIHIPGAIIINHKGRSTSKILRPFPRTTWDTHTPIELRKSGFLAEEFRHDMRALIHNHRVYKWGDRYHRGRCRATLRLGEGEGVGGRMVQRTALVVTVYSAVLCDIIHLPVTSVEKQRPANPSSKHKVVPIMIRICLLCAFGWTSTTLMAGQNKSSSPMKMSNSCRLRSQGMTCHIMVGLHAWHDVISKWHQIMGIKVP